MNSPSNGCGDNSAACPDLATPMLDRRRFLLGTGAAVAWVVLPDGSRTQAAVAQFQRMQVGRVSRLKPNAPSEFQYPVRHENAVNTLIRLNEPAGGGVGPDNSIVAFNNLCTHLGASMTTTFDGKAGIAGPCPLHWTTFDLSRHGMVISGHATLSLTQILLEVEDDNIFAVGVQGLIYGTHDNFAGEQ